MKFLSFLILSIILFAGCGERSEFSSEQLNIEKEKIKSRINSFFSSYEKKSMDEIISMLSTSPSFFYMGSDVNEIGKGKADFQNQLDMDWKLFDSVKFGEIKNISVIISPDGNLAASLVETTLDVVISENASSFTMRASFNFIKESGIWKIAQILLSVPSVGQSSVELVQKKDSTIK